MWDEEAMSPEENQRNLEQAKRFLLKYECKLMKVLGCRSLMPAHEVECDAANQH